MPRINIDLSDGFYVSDSLPVASMECTNWYVNIPDAQSSLTPAALFGTPGISELVSSGNILNANRGAHVKNGIPYFVNGNNLVRLDISIDASGNESFDYVSLGTVSGSGRVSMADNGTQLMIQVDGGDGYIYNENDGTPFQQITDPAYLAIGARYVEYIDGFFVVTSGERRFYKSAANDGLSWNALDFGSAELDPDNIVSAVSFKGQLFIGGSQTVEVFDIPSNVGSGFPFSRVEGYNFSKGVFAPFTMIEAHDRVVFIGGGVNESPAIWGINGNSLEKISNRAIDAELQKASPLDISTAFAYSYAQMGAYFILFSLASVTYAYDITNGKWHKRTSKITDPRGETRILRWRPNSLVTAYNRVLVGDSQSGVIGEVSTGTYTEYGNQIIREFTTIPFSSHGNPVTVPQIEVTVESGVGDLATPDPKIRMSYSDDAKTFGNERTASIGRAGEYNRRCIFYRNGRAPRYRVYKFEMSDAVKPVIVKIDANIRGGEIGS